LSHQSTNVRWFSFPLRSCLGFMLAAITVGCSHELYQAQRTLTQPLLPARASAFRGERESSKSSPVSQVSYNEAIEGEELSAPSGIDSTIEKPHAEVIDPPPPSLPASLAGQEVCTEQAQTLTVPAAISLAFQLQPRLKASLETIKQARGRQEIAFSAFLPTVAGGYSVGGYGLDVNGAGIPLPNSPPFTFLPGVGSLPVGFDLQSGYGLAELKLQWLICDFGRRTSKYRQAGLAVDIAGLQTSRAYQTVADEVETTYYQVLRTKSLHRIAEEAVHRAGDDLDVAQKLAKGGVIAKEAVLRATVASAQAQRVFDVSEQEQAIAVAALNLAIGLNICAPTEVIDTSDVPKFTDTLCDCLNTSVGNRREFQIARKSVQVAQEGAHSAQIDFAPRIVADGYLNNFQQSSPSANANLGVGFIKLEWGLYEGGRRVAELDVDNSRVREARAQADAIADNIAFQVSQAYYRLVAARKAIDSFRPAVDQTREAYRLVVARTREGDATPTELTEAQASLTRAQQDYFNSIYDYLIALAHLNYAMGCTPNGN
jgi:outer membrane protein TolC